MCVRILLEEPFSLQCPLNVFGRDFTLFDDAVSQHGNHASMKEIR